MTNLGPNKANELEILQREGEEGFNTIRAVLNEVPVPAGGIGFPIPPSDDTIPHGTPLDEVSEDDGTASQDEDDVDVESTV